MLNLSSKDWNAVYSAVSDMSNTTARRKKIASTDEIVAVMERYGIRFQESPAKETSGTTAHYCHADPVNFDPNMGPCVLREGHPGLHRDTIGDEWHDRWCGDDSTRQGIREASSRCVRTRDHAGSHRDNKGGEWQ